MTKLEKLEPRKATLSIIYHPFNRTLLDKSILIYYPNPHSFTGEDTIEIFTHGGNAVIRDTLEALSLLDQFRVAEPGEFSRRAFMNGKMDLTEVNED
jgi:tRNA modification GTPase